MYMILEEKKKFIRDVQTQSIKYSFVQSNLGKNLGKKLNPEWDENGTNLVDFYESLENGTAYKTRKKKKKLFEKRYVEDFKITKFFYRTVKDNDFFEQNKKRYHFKRKKLKKNETDAYYSYVGGKDIAMVRKKNHKNFFDKTSTRKYWYKYLVPDIGYYGSSFWGRDMTFMVYDNKIVRHTIFHRLYENPNFSSYDNNVEDISIKKK